MQARKLLTPCQKELLDQTRSKGMTENILLSWSPEANVYKNVTLIQQPDNADQQVVENTFTKDHAVAVLYLINQEKLAADAAIQEVSGITAGEARFLVIAYIAGVRGDDLRSINTEECTIDSHEFHEAFRFLIKQKLSTQQAMQELDHLTPYQVRMLHELYQYGLRAEHIHTVLADDKSRFADAFDSFGRSGKYRSFFCSMFKKAITQHEDVAAALQDTLGNYNQRTEEKTLTIFKIPYNPAVSFMRTQGLFANDLPENFTSEHKKLFGMLRRDRYGKAAAMSQLRQLDAVGARVMLTYFKQGVRAEHVSQEMSCKRNELEQAIADRVAGGQAPIEALASLHSVSNDNNAPKM